MIHSSKSESPLQYAQTKALISTIIFSGWALLWATHVYDWGMSLLPIASYGILVLNTYFSIRAFSQIIPRESISQNFIDAALATLYLILPLQFNNHLNFAALGMLLFSVTVIKYAILIRQLPDYQNIIARKTYANGAGMLLYMVSTGITLGGHGLLGASLYVSAFLVATFYFFFINPLYVISQNT